MLVLTASAIVTHRPRRGDPIKLEIETWVYPAWGLVESVISGVITASLLIGKDGEVQTITDFILKRLNRLIAHQAAREIILRRQVAALPARTEAGEAAVYLKEVGHLASRAWRVPGVT